MGDRLPGAGKEAGVIDVLWTGGWDSTFRVLDLVLTHSVRVQPHYVIYDNRLSLLHELRAMRAVRDALGQLDPAAAERLLATRITNASELRPDKLAYKRLHSLQTRWLLGGQNVGLSEYARKCGVGGLELGIYKTDPEAKLLRAGCSMERVRTGDGLEFWKVPEDVENSDLLLFTPFRFPLFEMTKADMVEEATQQGYRHLLEMTWFCHWPLGNRPCGYCLPCRFLIREGMGYRFPVSARLRYPMGKLLYPVRIARERPDQIVPAIRNRLRRLRTKVAMG